MSTTTPGVPTTAWAGGRLIVRMNVLNRILRAGDGRRLKAATAIVPKVNALEPVIEKKSDDELAGMTAEFRRRLDNGASLDDLLYESFAVTREAARRVIGQRHYDVQIIGGAVLHWGWVAEMKTGEGKTLSSTLPVYLNALSGDGVHVVSVNDYLVSRDSEWMGQIHRFLGLEVGLVTPQTGKSNPALRKKQYAADITYATNNEVGFDYLRDNMASSRDAMVQRGHNFAIVDEIDSILIDEARTPLIISGRFRGAADLYYQFAEVVRRLDRDADYEVDEEKRVVAISDDGISHVEELLGVENLYDGVQQDLVHQLQAALRAKELFHRDKDYLVANGEVKIVDEFTGRVLDGRRWSDGLHQAVEAKEGVKIKEEQQTLATVTLQNYFRMYDKLAGMTGTAQSDAAELGATYGLEVVQVPTNKPIARIDQEDLIYKTEDGKFGAIVADLKERNANGQPVLVGTASVEKSEKLSNALNAAGLDHEVLNAKQHFREAEVVAQAGQPGAITVATNMAGRGVDIVLGGSAENLSERDTLAEGLELDTPEGQEHLAQRMAYWEPLCASDAERVRDVGGLYVLGTERHDSRRIDNQLRGRAGRQGDPGESRFYLSLEDDLMRVFARGAMSWVMDRALPEDVPIESKMVTKSVERAQTTVEQRNAETRKNVLKYDEVLNQQRSVIYRRRRQILDDGSLVEDTEKAIDKVADVLTSKHLVEELDDSWDADGMLAELNTFWSSEFTSEQIDDARSRVDVAEMVSAEGRAKYQAREDEFTPEVMRQIERQIMLQLIDQRWREHLTEMDQLRDGIGLRAIGQRDPLTEYQREGFELFGLMMESLALDFVRYIMHVELAPQPELAPENSEQAGPDSDDPDGAPEVTETTSEDPPAVAQKAARGPVGRPVPTASNVMATKQAIKGGGVAAEEEEEPASRTVVNDEWDNTPRNAPCPCGSGKKFKLCHGRR